MPRAAQSFFTLPFAELLQDFALFVLCRPGGMLDTWRDATEQGRGFGPATFGGQATLTVLLKGETPEPLVRQLKIFEPVLSPSSCPEIP